MLRMDADVGEDIRRQRVEEVMREVGRLPETPHGRGGGSVCGMIQRTLGDGGRRNSSCQRATPPYTMIR